MKYEYEELISYAEDAIGSIKIAISEIEDIKEYKEVYERLIDDLGLLQEQSEIYKKAYYEESQREYDYMDREYERSVI